jgi:aminoglycoside/choline kinase family phosphotransferase
VDTPDGGTAIVMDAPPPQEDVRPFVKVAGLFGETGVTVPKVLAQDAERGFLLLSDLGSTTYLSHCRPIARTHYTWMRSRPGTFTSAKQARGAARI